MTTLFTNRLNAHSIWRPAPFPSSFTLHRDTQDLPSNLICTTQYGECFYWHSQQKELRFVDLKDVAISATDYMVVSPQMQGKPSQISLGDIFKSTVVLSASREADNAPLRYVRWCRCASRCRVLMYSRTAIAVLHMPRRDMAKAIPCNKDNRTLCCWYVDVLWDDDE